MKNMKISKEELQIFVSESDMSMALLIEWLQIDAVFLKRCRSRCWYYTRRS